MGHDGYWRMLADEGDCFACMLAARFLSSQHDVSPVAFRSGNNAGVIMSRTLRYLLSALILLFIAAAGMIFAARSALSPDALRERAVRNLATFTGREVTVDGPVEVRFFPMLAVEFEGLAIGNPEGFDAPEPLLRIRKANASVRLVPLLSNRVEFDHFRLEGLHIAAVRNANGERNWVLTPTVEQLRATARTAAQNATATTEATMPRTPPRDTAATTLPPEAPAGDATMPSLHFDKLELIDATLSFRDVAGASSFRARDMDLLVTMEEHHAVIGFSCSVAGDSPEFAAGLSMDATMSTLADGVLAIDMAPLAIRPHGGALPESAGPLDVRGRLRIDLGGGGNAPVLAIDTLTAVTPYLTADLTGTITPGTAASLNVALSGTPRKALAAFGIIHPTQDPRALEQFTAKSALHLTPDTLRLTGIDGRLDDTTFKGDATIPFADAKPLAGKLALGSLVLDRYLPSEHLRPHPKKGDAATQGAAASPAKGALPSASQPVGGGGEPAKGTADTKGDGGLLNNLRLDADVSAQHLVVARLDLRDLSARVIASGGVFTANPLQCRFFDGPLRGHASADLRQKAPAYAVNVDATGIDTGAMLVALTGKRHMEARTSVKGDARAKGSTADALMRTLDGTARITARDIVLHDGNAVPRDASGPASNADARRFDLLSGTFVSTGGVVRNDDLILRGPSANAEAKGIIDLPGDNIGYIATLHLKGLPDIPVRIRGSLSDPQYGVDPARMVVNTLKEAVKVLEAPADAGEKAAKGLGDILRNLLP